jgi:aconitate hydratase
MYLGVKAVIAMAIERIHAANLVNFGIIPLIFEDRADYDAIAEGDTIEISDVRTALEQRAGITAVVNGSREIRLKYNLTDEDIRIILAGGRLNLR